VLSDHFANRVGDSFHRITHHSLLVHRDAVPDEGAGDGQRVRVEAVVTEEFRANREARGCLSLSAHSILLAA
jgi:hypothetical protein